MSSTIIKLTLAFIPGVWLGLIFELQLNSCVLLLLVGLGLFLFAWLRSQKMIFPDAFFGSTSFLFFFILGLSTATLHLPQNQPRHFLNHFSEEENVPLKVQVVEVLKPDNYNEKYVAKIVNISGKTAQGKLLLLKAKDSMTAPLRVGQQLWTFANPQPLPGPLNPHQFDYAQFMENRGINRQIKITQSSFEVLPQRDEGIWSHAEDLRRNIKESLEKNDFDSRELAIVHALLLGQKQDISAEVYNNFAAAGVIHILAVSGLHVGIILIMLNWLFEPLERWRRGRLLKTLLLITCLWLFAFLAGLSPSVVRAVTMFSFIAVGMSLKRQTSTLNSVFLSLLFILLMNPQWIFEIGFQLSYSAVLAIILIRPLFYKLYQPEHPVPKYVWGLFSVTAAAQIGVLPLSLYYFHQFPGLFFLSNLLILPALGFILIFGIIVIVLTSLSALPGFVAEFYEGLLEILLSLVARIAAQESFIFRDIHFSRWEMIAFYILIISLVMAAHSFSYKKLLLVFFSVIGIQLIYLHEKMNFSEELIVFNKSRNTLIGKKEKSMLTLFHDLEEPPEKVMLVRNYMVGEDLEELEEKHIENALAFRNELLFIIDSTGIYPKVPLQDYILLLKGSPKINLDRILQQHRPKVIIADGSNYKNLVAHWQKTSRENGIKFHSTSEAGAFILK